MSTPETAVDPRSLFGTSAPSGPQFERRKLKENEPSKPFRIFPPMHSMISEKTGSFVYCSQHFGYQGKDPKIPTKLKMRPFVCIEEKDFKTKMTKVSCPQCRLIEKNEAALKDLKDKATGELKPRGITDPAQQEEFLKPILGPLTEWGKRYNLDTKCYLNAVEADGTLALYQIPHKAKVALDVKIAELRAQGIEPINEFEQGVYFVLQRHGSWNNATFSASVLEEQVGNTKGLMQKKWAPLSMDTLSAALKNLPDLGKLGTMLSKEQVQMLVDCGGSAEEVDSIFGMTKRPDRERSPSTLPAAQQMMTPVVPTVPAAATAVTAVTAPVIPTAPVVVPEPAAPAAPAVDPEEAEMLALQARIAARKAAAAKPVTAATAAPAAPVPQAQNYLDPNLTPTEFAAMFPKMNR